MNKRAIFLWSLILSMTFYFVVGTLSSPAVAFDYTGKWYGWWNPYVDRDSGLIETPQGWGYGKQEILNSWGYKGNNVDEIKDLLPPIFYQVVKEPEKWGRIRVNETEFISRSETEMMKRYAAYTKKYKGQPSLDENGQLLNYTGGCPFPGSTDPLELAWNNDKQAFFGDCMYGESLSRITDINGNARTSVQDLIKFKYDGRIFGDKAPLYLPNPDGRDNISVLGFRHPYSVAGMVQLTVRYLDAKKDDDMWMYLPSMRRTRRMSTAQRWDRLPGGLVDTWDTVTGWSGRVINYDWKYLGRKKMLAPHNSNPMVQTMKTKPGGPPDQNFQRMEVMIIEFTPKPYMHAPASKGNLYIDPESYVHMYTETFDKKGRPWFLFIGPKIWDKTGAATDSSMMSCDLQRVYSSPPAAFTVRLNEDEPKANGANFYSIEKLKKHFGAR